MSCKSGISGKKTLKMDDSNHQSPEDVNGEKKIKDLIVSHLKFR